MSGERLTTDQRTDFTKQAANIFSKRLQQKEKLTKKYVDFARRTDADPRNVVGDEDMAGGTGAGAAKLPGGWTVTEGP